jgi:hypothetical protein
VHHFCQLINGNVPGPRLVVLHQLLVHYVQVQREELGLVGDGAQHLLHIIKGPFVLVDVVEGDFPFTQAVVAVLEVCFSPQFLLADHLPRNRPQLVKV